MTREGVRVGDCGPSLHGTPGDYPQGYQELASGVFAWLQPNGAWGETNAGLVVGRGEAMLVDTLWDERLAARMLVSTIPLLKTAQLSTVVNTHRDGDHYWGNAAMSPQVDIWASTATVAEMRAEPPPASLARLRNLSRLGALLPGPVGRLSRYTKDMLDPFHFAGTPRLPDRTFEKSQMLVVGGRQVNLMRFGPAHTLGDSVVHLPADGVVFAGDLLFVGVTPVVWDGPVKNWIAALRRLLALDASVYVPGHGPVGGRPEVERLLAYWEWFVGATDAAIDRGLARGELVAAVAADPGFGEWRSLLNPERLALNVLAYHRERTGDPYPGPEVAHRPWLFRHVADLSRTMKA